MCLRWLKEFDEKMVKEGRKVVLFLDNFTAHEAAVEQANLENVRIEWLPPNCTSLVQPIDIMGVGNALKSRYRKYLNNYVPNNVFQNKKNACEGIDLLKALVWFDRAFNSLNHSETVTKCFAKAGFTLSPDIIPVDDDDVLMLKMMLNSLGKRP